MGHLCLEVWRGQFLALVVCVIGLTELGRRCSRESILETTGLGG